MATVPTDGTGERLAALPSGLPLRRAADLAGDTAVLPTGQAALDATLDGGLARARIHLLTGTRGGGAASLLHLMLAAVTPTAPVLLLDPHHRFVPPAARVVGAALSRLLLVRHRDAHTLERALAAALRTGACPLIVWDVGSLPPLPLLDRLRPLVRVGGRKHSRQRMYNSIASPRARGRQCLAARHRRLCPLSVTRRRRAPRRLACPLEPSRRRECVRWSAPHHLGHEPPAPARGCRRSGMWRSTSWTRSARSWKMPGWAMLLSISPDRDAASRPSCGAPSHF